MSPVAFACRSNGGSCEWTVETDSNEGILQPFAEHQKCAYHVPVLSDVQRHQVAAPIRSV
jgi:predicted small metal-binding protein